MIVGIGCDIVEHDLTRDLNWESDTNILKRVFSPTELQLYETQKNIEFISGHFAAKEAILKCLGTGMQDGISLTDIQILKEGGGKPLIEIRGEVKRISDGMGINFWHISITHSKNSSTAFAIAEA